MQTEQHARTDLVVARSFPCAPDQVGPARRWAARIYADAGADPDVCRLLVSEAATNAVEHTRSDVFTVCIDLEGLWIEVSDASSTSPQFRSTTEELADGRLEPSEHGRGLELLTALAPGWQVRLNPDGGKSIRFRPLLPR